MQLKCLASSSSGNCYALTFEKISSDTPQSIFIDCGVSYDDIKRKCNENGLLLSKFRIVLLSHAHGDHSKSADKLLARGVKIYGSANSKLQIGENNDNFIEVLPNTIYEIKNNDYDFRIMPFEVIHDCAGTFGYIVSNKKEKLLFITDAKGLSNIDLGKYQFDMILIECNYDHTQVYTILHESNKIVQNYQNYAKEEVDKAKEQCRQIERNLNSHMSLHGTIELLKTLDLRKTKAIFLIHLSDRYANDKKMKLEVERKFGIKTFICKKSGGIY